MIQIAVGSTMPPITPAAIILTAEPVPLTKNKIMTAITSKRNGMMDPIFANPLLPSAFHLLL